MAKILESFKKEKLNGWILYFIFQADVVSALINVVCVAQLLVFLQREKYKWANSKLWLYFFVIIQIVIGALTFSKWHDIFAILAGVSSTVAYFVLNKKLYRFISLFSMSSWVLNSVFKWYIIALLHDSFATVSVLVSIVRFDILKQNDETPLNKV